MAEFQWKPGADQVFDNSYGDVTLQGQNHSFDKNVGKLFTLNTDKSLTLSEGPKPDASSEQNWDGEFHLVKGTFNVGLKDQPVNALIMYGEKNYSKPEYTLFRSRANFNAYAIQQIFIAGPDVERGGNNPVISLFTNSNTSLISPKNGIYGGVLLNKTTLNVEGNATLLIQAGSFQLDNSVVNVINTAKVTIGFNKYMFPPDSGYGYFNLGGAIGESNNNVQETANITFDQCVDFTRFTYPQGFFNFNTRDQNKNPISNKGKFIFTGIGNAFQVKALLQQSALAIDGIPTNDESRFSFLYQDPITQENMLIVSLK